ncbi:hypothetical protein Acr_28g0015350 [Actinidia rufa]|uniref:Uncharacterized protein n=1 Tax=Actinidia rufa TaxID=165716 RepID=A0A7J0HCH0_9ERIC|nr:hypothetical protein Acr_28g0015350 [Actinidia rufa]
MTDEVTQLPSSPREDPLSPEGSPSNDSLPPIEKETNTMTQDKLDCLGESGVQIRLPEVVRPSRLLAQEPLWPLQESESRLWMALLQGKSEEDPIRVNVKGWKKKFFFISGDNWDFPQGLSWEAGISRVPRSWGIPSKRCNKPPILFKVEQQGGAAPIAGEEGESHHSRDDPPEVTIPELGTRQLKLKLGGRVQNHGCPLSSDRMGDVKRGGEQRSSTYCSVVLGFKASMLENPDVEEKLLEGMIPPADKEVVGKLDLDWAISKFFHIVDQVVDELKKIKENRDATVERLEKEMAELKKNEALAKKLAIEEHKSSDDFQEAVEFTASKYSGEGFDFCKRQIGRLHPDLDIQDMGIDVELLKKEEDEEGSCGEKEKEEEEEEEEEGEPDNSLAPQ